jgi:DNA-binding response OmpR family regulator
MKKGKLTSKTISKKLPKKAVIKPAGITTSGNKKRVLLVEDDAFVSKAYAHFISRSGYQVDVAMNVIEARKKIASHIPNIILLDVIMPGINGFEYLEELKRGPKSRNIPVIMISNLCQESAISRCRKLGAADYLIKSNFFMRDVIERIDRHVLLKVR